jgi:hypothetical protein
VRDLLIPGALVVSALVLSVAVVGAHYMQRYQVAAVSGGDTAAWRIDTWSGKLELCTFNKSKNTFAKYDPDSVFDVECKDRIGGPVARSPQ